MLTIYDAVAWRTMPKGQPVLAYIDGNYVTYPVVLQLEPSLVFTVTTTGKNAADICDVESGDATPAQAAFGAKLGWWRTIYCSLSTFPDVKEAMLREGAPEWYWFAADPTGIPHLPQGASACQYAWHSLGQCPPNYDMSIATEKWVALYQNPPAPPTPEQQLQEAQIVAIIEMANGNLAVDAVNTDGDQLAFQVNPKTGGVNCNNLSAAMRLVDPPGNYKVQP